MSRTPLLDEINLPSDLRKVQKQKLPQLAGELRAKLIDALSVAGGHFGAGLG
jgi:1-deoxy-D-xylulose-5-phosphate synthase